MLARSAANFNLNMSAAIEEMWFKMLLAWLCLRLGCTLIATAPYRDLALKLYGQFVFGNGSILSYKYCEFTFKQ